MSIVKINDILKVEEGKFKVISSETSPTDNTPTYALYRSPSITDEGTTVTYILNTNNVAEGTLVAYTVTGISQADLSSGNLTGNFTVNAIGVATVSFTIANDQLTEGAETMSLSAAGQSLDVLINDTSLTPSGNPLFSYYLASKEFVGVLPDGMSDVVELPESPNLSLGTGNFTIQYWAYTLSIPQFSWQDILVQDSTTGTTPFRIYNKSGVNPSYIWQHYPTAPFVSGKSTVFLNNTWKHIAIVRNNGYLKIFINGILNRQGPNTTNFNSTGKFYLGGWSITYTQYQTSGFKAFTGTLNSFSIAKGSALYTTNFTPPPRV